MKLSLTLWYGIQLLWLVLPQISSWSQWDYKTTWALDGTTASEETLKAAWDAVWSTGKYKGASAAPRPRRGHSLHLIKTDERSIYGGDTYLFMFGGRDNDQIATHIPRTYNIKSVIQTLVLH